MEDTKYSCCSTQKDDEENVKMRYHWWLMMDQSSSAKKPGKSLSLASDSNRDKMALSDGEFPDALQSTTSSSESFDLKHHLLEPKLIALSSAHAMLSLLSHHGFSTSVIPFFFGKHYRIQFKLCIIQHMLHFWHDDWQWHHDDDTLRLTCQEIKWNGRECRRKHRNGSE